MPKQFYKTKPVLENIIRTEVRKALIFQLGFDAFHLPDQKMTLESRPDLLAYNAPLAIEVKRFEPLVREIPTFDTAKISNSQRKWFDTWEDHRHNYGFLAIGTSCANPAFPVRTIWAIPWKKWRFWEKSMIVAFPERLAGGFSFLIDAQELNHAFGDYRLIGNPTSGFTFGNDHPIWGVPGGKLPNWMGHKEFISYIFPERESKIKARKEKVIAASSENYTGSSQ